METATKGQDKVAIGTAKVKRVAGRLGTHAQA